MGGPAPSPSQIIKSVAEVVTAPVVQPFEAAKDLAQGKADLGDALSLGNIGNSSAAATLEGAKQGGKMLDQASGISAAQEESKAAIEALTASQAAQIEALKGQEEKQAVLAESTSVRDAALRRQRALQSQGARAGRRGTILTSPLGEVNQMEQRGKTLLGM